MMWSHKILVPCEDCGETFDNPEEYIKHIIIYHSPPKGPSAKRLPAPPQPPAKPAPTVATVAPIPHPVSQTWSTIAASHSQKGNHKDQREMVTYDEDILAPPLPPPLSPTRAPPLPPTPSPTLGPAPLPPQRNTTYNTGPELLSYLPQLPAPVGVAGPGVGPVLLPHPHMIAGLPPPPGSLMPNFSQPPPSPVIMNPALMMPPYMDMMQNPVFRE